MPTCQKQPKVGQGISKEEKEKRKDKTVRRKGENEGRKNSHYAAATSSQSTSATP